MKSRPHCPAGRRSYYWLHQRRRIWLFHLPGSRSIQQTKWHPYIQMCMWMQPWTPTGKADLRTLSTLRYGRCKATQMHSDARLMRSKINLWSRPLLWNLHWSKCFTTVYSQAFRFLSHRRDQIRILMFHLSWQHSLNVFLATLCLIPMYPSDLRHKLTIFDSHTTSCIMKEAV